MLINWISEPMKLDRAIAFTSQLLLNSRQKELSELEALILNAAWLNILYQEAISGTHYELQTIKNIAAKLFKDISTAAGVRVSKKNCKSIICNLAGIDRAHVDWGDAPIEMQPFCGRADELEQLSKWARVDRCKLVGVMGIGGIGKTALVAKLGGDINPDFDRVIWRSLREAPPLSQFLGEAIQFLSEFTEIQIPNSSERSIAKLLDCLNHKRCLILLDNVEAIIESGEYGGNYRSGYADYGQLLHRIGTSPHQSCLVFTSREPPPELTELAGVDLPVRSMRLSGLAATAPTLLSGIGLEGSDRQLRLVADRCQGNPLYLRIIANTIINNFNGDIEQFLTTNRFIYGKIATVLQSQLDRLSIIEKLIVYHLAIQREPISLTRIKVHLQPFGFDSHAVEIIDSIQQRSLLEITQGQRYTLQNVVMEFMTAAMIRELVEEITADLQLEPVAPLQELFFFNCLALYPASSPTYVREVQQRLVLSPLIDRLTGEHGRDRVIEYLRNLISRCQIAEATPGYSAGNIIDLLMVLTVDLDDFNLSNLYIAEVDFQTAILRNVDFTDATFDRCRFSQGMGTALKLTFSPHGKYLAVSDTMYQIKVWEVATNQEIAMLIGHQSWVWDVQFSQDSRYIASGSGDGTMRIWDLASGECLQVLDGHQDWVWKVHFMTNNMAISMGADKVFKVWLWRNKLNLLTFPIPAVHLRDGTFHGGRGLLAICGGEGIDIWQVWLGGRRLQKIATANALNLRRISFSHDGQVIVGTNFSCMIHCWDVNTGNHLFDLSGHKTQITEVYCDEDGQIISTCLEQIRVWNIETGACVKVLNLGFHSGKAVAYRSPLIATGSDNGTIKVWNLETGQCITTSSGNLKPIMGLAANPHDQAVVTSRDDGTIQIWDFSKIGLGESPNYMEVQAHRGKAKTVAFSLDGQSIASTGGDRRIVIWDAATGGLLQTLIGHTDYILQLLFIDDCTLLSQSYDKTIRQWNIITGEYKILFSLELEYIIVFCRLSDDRLIAFGDDTARLIILDHLSGQTKSYSGSGNRLQHLLFSLDLQFIIGITDDRILNLWEVNQNYAHRCWSIGDREVMSAVLHPHFAHLLIVGSNDGSIAIWDLLSQTCLVSLNGHQREIVKIAILPHPDRLVTCSIEGSIKLWELHERGLTELYEIAANPPYHQLNLDRVKGLNRAQLTTLVRLGAIAAPEA
jgi:WD40 repeat protein